jgi:hypothetical protein
MEVLDSSRKEMANLKNSGKKVKNPIPFPDFACGFFFLVVKSLYL